MINYEIQTIKRYKNIKILVLKIQSHVLQLYPNCVQQHCEQIRQSVRKAVLLFHHTGQIGEFITEITSTVATDLLSLTDRYRYEFDGDTMVTAPELLKFLYGKREA